MLTVYPESPADLVAAAEAENRRGLNWPKLLRVLFGGTSHELIIPALNNWTLYKPEDER